MCERTLPLLFCNLGGEMLYVLDQRLRAQVETKETKTEKKKTDLIAKPDMPDMVIRNYAVCLT